MVLLLAYCYCTVILLLCCFSCCFRCYYCFCCNGFLLLLFSLLLLLVSLLLFWLLLLSLPFRLLLLSLLAKVVSPFLLTRCTTMPRYRSVSWWGCLAGLFADVIFFHSAVRAIFATFLASFYSYCCCLFRENASESLNTLCFVRITTPLIKLSIFRFQIPRVHRLFFFFVFSFLFFITQ